MKITDAYPNKYLAAADLNGRDVTVTIKAVNMEKFTDGSEKPLATFEGAEKGMVLNKTNALAIAAMHGEDTESWTGKQVTLFPMMVTFQGKTTEAIRVKRPPEDNLVRPADDLAKPVETKPDAELKNSVPF